MSDKQYVVGIDDLFRVPADEVDGPDDAVRYAIDRIGEDGWEIRNASILEVEE